MPVESVEAGSSYEAFRAELEADRRKLRRRDLLLRLTSMALLLWIVMPRDTWSSPSKVAAYASGPMLCQVLLWLGWPQRVG